MFSTFGDTHDFACGELVLDTPHSILTVAGMVVLCWDLWMKEKDKWYLALVSI